MENQLRYRKVKIIYKLPLKVFSLMYIATKTVFVKRYYIILAASISTFFWFILNYLEQLIFFPYFVFYYPIPPDALSGFFVSNITSLLLGLVLILNVYVFRRSSIRFRISRDRSYIS